MTMTKLLKQVFKRLSNLPDDEQDAAAAVLIEELADEEKWAATFKDSQEALEALANDALEELEAGETTPLELSKGG